MKKLKGRKMSYPEGNRRNDAQIYLFTRGTHRVNSPAEAVKLALELIGQIRTTN